MQTVFIGARREEKQALSSLPGPLGPGPLGRRTFYPLPAPFPLSYSPLTLVRISLVCSSFSLSFWFPLAQPLTLVRIPLVHSLHRYRSRSHSTFRKISLSLAFPLAARSPFHRSPSHYPSDSCSYSPRASPGTPPSHSRSHVSHALVSPLSFSFSFPLPIVSLFIMYSNIIL